MSQSTFSLSHEDGGSFDILTEIFLRCLPDEEFIPPNPHHAPLLLTQVCRHWREVAVSMKPLWTSLMISLPEDSTGLHCSNLMSKWISRSGSGPLHLGLEDMSKGSEDSKRCFSLLAAHMFRCRSLKLNIHILDLDYFRDTEMPLLKTLYIVADGQVHSSKRVLPLFKVAPLLQAMSFDWDYPLASSFVDVPYAQLTSLSITNIFFMHKVTDVLQRCEQLLHCDLQFPYDVQTASHSNAGTVRLPMLQTLEIENPGSSHSFLVLKSLDLPKLRRLKLRTDSVYDNHVRANFLQFLRRNSPAELVIISLSSSPIVASWLEIFQKFLASVPYVKRLVLHFSQVAWRSQEHTDKCFDLLTIQPHIGGCFLPRLEVLEILLEDTEYDPNEDVVKQMLTSRVRPPSGAPLDACLREGSVTIVDDGVARRWSISDSGDVVESLERVSRSY